MTLGEYRTFKKTASGFSNFVEKLTIGNPTGEVKGLGLIGDFLGSAASASGKAAVDIFTEKYLKPKPSALEGVGKILQTIGIGVGVGGGMVGIGALIDKYNIHRAQTASPMLFQEMLIKNNDINEIYLSGPDGKEKIEDLFKVLEHFAPKIAENSLAAGTFIRQYAKFGDLGANPDVIETLSRIHKNVTDQKGGGIASAGLNKLFETGIATSYKEMKD